MPDAADFDIRFVSADRFREFVLVMVNKGLDPRSDGVAVVSDSLVGDLDPMHVVHQRGCLS
jgi:hypothetical protein